MPPTMRRSVALPDAETPSYWPVCMSETISSEVPAIFALVLHPVACSNGVTQLTFGSVAPLSAYPAQTMMLRAPSPAPILAWPVLTGVGLAPPPLPHAAATTARLSPPTHAFRALDVMTPPPLFLIVACPPARSWCCPSA